MTVRTVWLAAGRARRGTDPAEGAVAVDKGLQKNFQTDCREDEEGEKGRK